MLKWWRKRTNRSQRKISTHAGAYFKDSRLAEQYVKDGFVVVPQVISEEIIRSLLLNSEEFIHSIHGKFAYSTMILDEDDNLKIHEQSQKILHSVLEQLFVEYKTYSSTYLVKAAQTGSEMKLHQDWSFTDENIFLPATLWLPLQNVDQENGAMFLIKNSHTFFNNRRSHSLATARIESNGILKKFVETIELKQGDLLLFNPAIFHGSHPNYSSQHRLAFTMTIMPKEAPFLYYHHWKKNKIQVLKLEDDALLKQMKVFDQVGEIYGEEFERLDYRHEIPLAKTLYEMSKAVL